MKRLFFALALCVWAAFPAVSSAELCSNDVVPAATLLLPYFEVDLENPDCVTTLFSVNNASATPTLAHVTFWTDWSQPTLDFDMFLTGYDVITVNLRHVFDGYIPITADAQSDLDNTISPHGQNPDWDGSFPGCDTIFPFFENPVITGDNLDRLVNGHLGRPVESGNGMCMGHDHGDGIARGYITIDDARRCSLEFPSDDSYFGGLDPVASNDNQLWGDYFIIDPPNNFAFGESLVHIEASDDFDAGSTPTGYTFYGRYTGNTGGLDQREPLGTTHAVRYLNGGGFDGGTDLLVWRDSTSSNTDSFYACGEGPDWGPLNETEVVVFNEQEDAAQICLGAGQVIISPPTTPEDPTCFPLETQRSPLGEGDLALPYDFGWLFLNLNINDEGITGDTDFGTGGTLAQSYVAAMHSASGLYQVGLQSLGLTHACEDVDPSIVSLYDIPVYDGE